MSIGKKRITGACIALLIFLLAAFTLVGCGGNGQGSQAESGPAGSSAQAIVEDAGPFVLPDPNEVSSSQQPIMYDFVNGCLGLNDELVPMVGPVEEFVLAVKNGSDEVYVAMQYGGEGDYDIELFLPVFSSAPMLLDLDEADADSLKSALNALVDAGKATSVAEGTYTFYEVPYSVAFLDKSASLDMVDFEGLLGKYQVGEYKKRVEAGMGIPTEIIRAKCDLQAINEVSKIDFDDPFWDNVNYGSRIKVYKANGSSDYCILTPIHQKLVAGYGEPLYMFAVNGMSRNMTVEKLDQYLVEHGYESIDEAISSQNYATEDELERIGDFRG